MATLNPLGKSRTEDNPYLIVEGAGGFTYRVLKAYALDPDKKNARWFLATSSPYTFGSNELGDGYIADVAGTITYRDPAVPDEAIPSHLKGGAIKNRSSMSDIFGD